MLKLHKDKKEIISTRLFIYSIAPKPGRSTYHNNNIKARPSKPKVPTAADTALKNVSALPTKGEFDHTNRPGVVVWKVPQVKPEQAKDSKQVLLGPMYRLPLDSDDTGSLIQMEWNYVNLKVRPENLTLEAIGPNKAAWSITTVEGTATKATWDLRATPSYSPLIEGYYTIHLHDQRGPGTLPKPGWLLPDKSLKIALYKADGNNHVGEFIARKFDFFLYHALLFIVAVKKKKPLNVLLALNMSCKIWVNGLLQSSLMEV